MSAPDPEVPAVAEPVKPIRSFRILAFALVGLFALFLVSRIAQCGRSSDPAASRRALPAGVVKPEAVAAFERNEQEQATKMKREAAAATEAQEKARRAYDSYTGGLPCNAALAGTPGTAVDGSPIVCGPDGAWQVAGHANQADPPRDAAADRRAKSVQAEADRRTRIREEAERRKTAALNSSGIAIDFSDRGTAGTPAPGTVSAVPVAATPAQQAPASAKPPVPAKEEPATPSYRVSEGTILEAVLTNRINGSAAGPVNIMLTTDVWSRNLQRLLIPQGTRCFGKASAVNSQQQQRLFVAFHRCIMPDGFSLDLDQFAGLSQIGEVGLRDKVNHHYLQIFGASLAIGAVGGLAQIGNSTGYGYDPAAAMRVGVSQQLAQESIHVLDHFLNQLPTFTVRERSRVRIYLASDLDVPAYDTHPEAVQ